MEMCHRHTLVIYSSQVHAESHEDIIHFMAFCMPFDDYGAKWYNKVQGGT